MLFQPEVMEIYLLRRGVLLKDFKPYVLALTKRIKLLAKETAAKAGRPVHYLSSWTQSKEDLAREIARKDRIKTGLIAVFSAVEGCTSYTVPGNRETKQFELVLQPSRCTHLYHYFIARGVRAVPCAGADLVSLQRGYLPERPAVAGPPDDPSGPQLRATRQLLCAGQ